MVYKGKSIYKWMTAGTSILGHHHMSQCISMTDLKDPSKAHPARPSSTVLGSAAVI